MSEAQQRGFEIRVRVETVVVVGASKGGRQDKAQVRVRDGRRKERARGRGDGWRSAAAQVLRQGAARVRSGRQAGERRLSGIKLGRDACGLAPVAAKDEAKGRGGREAGSVKPEEVDADLAVRRAKLQRNTPSSR